MKKILTILLLAICSTSCVVVKEYDKVYLNDEDMLLSVKNIEQSEINFQVYREGSAGANGGKTGGGCGCN